MRAVLLNNGHEFHAQCMFQVKIFGLAREESRRKKCQKVLLAEVRKVVIFICQLDSTVSIRQRSEQADIFFLLSRKRELDQDMSLFSKAAGNVEI